jgi:hypothetical protein
MGGVLDLCGCNRLVLRAECDHNLVMAPLKTSSAGFTIRNPRTGQFVTIKGAGALRGKELSLKPGLDLTKPIAQQALKNIRKPRAS